MQFLGYAGARIAHCNPIPQPLIHVLPRPRRMYSGDYNQSNLVTVWHFMKWLDCLGVCCNFHITMNISAILSAFYEMFRHCMQCPEFRRIEWKATLKSVITLRSDVPHHGNAVLTIE